MTSSTPTAHSLSIPFRLSLPQACMLGLASLWLLHELRSRRRSRPEDDKDPKGGPGLPAGRPRGLAFTCTLDLRVTELDDSNVDRISTSTHSGHGASGSDPDNGSKVVTNPGQGMKDDPINRTS